MILNERKDYETLVITKRVLFHVKNIWEKLQGTGRDKFIGQIPVSNLKTRDLKFPDYFKAVQIEFTFDPSEQDYSISGFAKSSYMSSPDNKQHRKSNAILAVQIFINKEFKEDKAQFYSLYGTDFTALVKSTIRHELEHTFQKPDPDYRPDKSNSFQYYYCDQETEAYVSEAYRQAKHYKVPFLQMLEHTLEEVKANLNRIYDAQPAWKKWIKKKNVDQEFEFIKIKWLKYAKKRFPKAVDPNLKTKHSMNPPV